MERRVVSKEAVRRSVVRSTMASAQLEGRTVPADFIRSERVEQYLAEGSGANAIDIRRTTLSGWRN